MHLNMGGFDDSEFRIPNSEFIKKLRPFLYLLVSAVLFLVSFELFFYDSPGFDVSLFDQISFDVRGQDITAWREPASGEYYVFLPACAPENVRIYIPEGVTLLLGGEPIGSGGKLIPALNEKLAAVFCDKDGQTIERGNITFMRSKNADAVFITLPEGGAQRVDGDKKHREYGVAAVFSVDGHAEYIGGAAMNGRGNSTWAQPKKGYNIKLDRPVGLLGMGAAKKWSLLANYYDGAGIRNKIVCDAALAAGLDSSPQSRFVDFYVNGEYRGLYQLCEHVEIGENGVGIRSLKQATEAVNAAPLAAYGTVTEEGDGAVLKGVNIPNNPADITGGYLCMMDFSYRFDAAASGFITPGGQCVIIKSPKYASVSQARYISGFMSGFEAALTNEDDDISKYIDVESWVKYCLVQEVFANQDAGLSSGYFYKAPDSEGGLLFAGPVWDFDASLGNAFPPARYPWGLKAMSEDFYRVNSLASGLSYGRWHALLYSRPAFREAVISEYKETFLPILNQLIESGIDEYAAAISDAAACDELRWRMARGNFTPVNPEAFSGDMKKRAGFVMDFLTERRDFLSDLWINETPYVTVTIHTKNDPIYPYHQFAVKEGARLGEFLNEHIPALSAAELCYDGTEDAFDKNAPLASDVNLEKR